MNKKLAQSSKMFESKIRIQMIASLSVSNLTYSQLKNVCECSDGNMTTHTKKLIETEFVTVDKKFVNNKPQTTYSLTNNGRKAFREYVDALNELIGE